MCPKSNKFTCKTYNGQSVVDYLICLQSIITKVVDFRIKQCPIELNSNHMPLYIKYNMKVKRLKSDQVLDESTKGHKEGKILINNDNKKIFCTALEQ